MKPAPEPASPPVQSPEFPWKVPQKSCPFAASGWLSHLAVVRNQLSLQKPPGSRLWFSRTKKVQHLPRWLVDDRATLQPSPNLMLTRPIEHTSVRLCVSAALYQAVITCLSARHTLPKDTICYWRSGEAHLAK